MAISTALSIFFCVESFFFQFSISFFEGGCGFEILGETLYEGLLPYMPFCLRCFLALNVLQCHDRNFVNGLLCQLYPLHSIVSS